MVNQKEIIINAFEVFNQTNSEHLSLVKSNQDLIDPQSMLTKIQERQKTGQNNVQKIFEEIDQSHTTKTS